MALSGNFNSCKTNTDGHTHKHTDIVDKSSFKKAVSKNHSRTGLWPARTWFNASV